MFTIRVTGPDFDISLAISCEEDFEIMEKLLAKIRASFTRVPDSAEAKP